MNRRIASSSAMAVLALVAVVLGACTPPPDQPGGDTTPPALSLPGDLTVAATDASGAVVTWTATATDEVDGDVPVTCAPPSGSQFSVGDTGVSCTATDAAGNDASGSFTVTVTDLPDTTPPALTLPVGIVSEATGPGGADVTWSATATDDTDGPVAVECSPEPGTFPIGDTVVSCTAEDAAGNGADGDFTVSVVDTTPPVLTLPAGLTVPTVSPSGAEVGWTTSATDLVDGDVLATCTPPPGVFPVGDTQVDCTATDVAGNVADGSFIVTVTFTDEVPPVLTLPADIEVPAVDASGAPVTWSASATDDIDGAVPVSCTPTPGTFPIGETVVSCTAQDAAGNVTNGNFTVSVSDTTAPVLSLPTDLSVAADAPSGTEVTWTATATDDVDGPVSVDCTPTPGTFPVGDTQVDCTATDGAGNVATGSFTVTVDPYELPDSGRLAAGDLHTCTVSDSGSALCWGALPLIGTGGAPGTAVAVPDLTDAVAVSPGSSHSCALTAGGAVRCWGWNNWGQLGDGTTTNSTTPVSVTGISDAVAVAVGSQSSCALLGDGTVRCWGYNNVGQLGDGTTTNSTTPVSVTGISDATAITAGLYHVCAVMSDETARCWGYGHNGQLGDGTNTVSAPSSVAVSGLSGAVAIEAGRLHTCALLSDGTARCWGVNWGTLGTGTTNHSNTPVTVSNLTDAIAITGGDDHTCAVIVDGTARCWGLNGEGQLGSGVTSNAVLSPTPVAGLAGAVSITAGTDHTCAQLTDDSVRCWGGNQYGQLGIGTTADSATPTSVAGLVGATDITAGASHTCALVGDGTIRCWGSNANGRLGTGSSSSVLLPFAFATPTAAVAGITDATGVTAGASHTCALVGGGSIRCWGDNSGRLGNGSTTNSNVPVAVTGITDAVAVSAGRGSHTCAALADGTVRCWGGNGSGQLGDGTTTTATTPVTVTGIDNAVDVTVGVDHSCAVLDDGTARCWGNNQGGQLGDGTYVGPSLVPVTVSGLGDVAIMTAGFRFTCAALTDGTARCWGPGADGRLGNGSTSTSNTPVVVTGLTGVTTLDSGDAHTCAALALGEARCWGSGLGGQLGDGANESASTPVTVSGLSGVVAVGSGTGHSCAVLESGTARCWGGNTNGQLGDDRAWSAVPVQVLGLS